MGKGDIKSYKGKLFNKSYGAYRRRRKHKSNRSIADMIPKIVLDQIKQHLRKRTEEAERQYASTKGKEDAVTGCLFGMLRATDNIVVDGWTWSIEYKISNQRKKGIFNEKETGADGIISINIDRDGKTETKSILFQAKQADNNDGISDQSKKMRETLSGGNMIIIYSDDGFYAQTANNFDKVNKKQTRFSDYFINVFLACKSGCWGYKKYKSGDSEVKLYCLSINIKKEC